MKISIKKATFDLPRNYLKLCKYELSSLENQKSSSKLRIPSELKNLETEVSLKRFHKKKTIYSGNGLYWKLKLPTPEC